MKNKITTLILSLMGFAGYAQTGNVGVNTTAPKATMDVKAQTPNNTADVEGLLMPRVSKEKVFLMGTAATLPDESTMVYVSDTISTALSGATAAQLETVADVNEKGYYFWNSTKWVKATGNNGGPWFKNAETKEIEILDENMSNVVKYDSLGGYFNYPKDPTTYQAYDYNLVASSNLSVPRSNSGSFSFYRTNHIAPIVNLNGNYSAHGVDQVVEIDTLQMNDGNNSNYIHQELRTIVPTTTEQGVRLVRTGVFTSEKLDGYNSNLISSVTGRTFDVGSGVTESVISIEGGAQVQKPSGSVENVIGGKFVSKVRDQNAADVFRMNGVQARAELTGSGDVDRMTVFSSDYRTQSGYTGTVTSAYDLYTSGNQTNIINQYGVFVRGDQKTNYFEGRLGIGQNPNNATTSPSKLLVHNKVDTNYIAQFVGDSEDVLYNRVAIRGTKDGAMLSIENAEDNRSFRMYSYEDKIFKLDLSDSALGTTNLFSSRYAPTAIEELDNLALGGLAPADYQFTVHADAGEGAIKTNGTVELTSGQVLANRLDNAVNPSYSWNDNSCGMFRPIPKEIGFSTDSLERMRITATGKVGIGTSVPESRLHIVYDDAGEVGLGNDLLIDIHENSDDNSPFTMRRSRGTAATPVNLQAGDGLSGVANVGYVNGQYAYLTGLGFSYVGDGTNKNSEIQVTNSGVVAMLVDEDNNVGIGTSSPSEKLEVNGKIKAVDVNFSGLPEHADEAAATAAGLESGDMYKTATGELRIKL